MLLYIPALEYMQHIAGIYESKNDPVAHLRIRSCGYGIAFEITTKTKADIIGVVGVNQSTIECFAQIGLPNIVHMNGVLSSNRVDFMAIDPAISISFSSQSNLIHVDINLDGKILKKHIFYKTST